MGRLYPLIQPHQSGRHNSTLKFQDEALSEGHPWDSTGAKGRGFRWSKILPVRSPLQASRV